MHRMYINCNDKELEILDKIALSAEELGLPCYLIGGFVRDKILGRNTKDMDIVCVGDGIELAARVAEKFNPKPEVNFFKNFGTAQIKINDPIDVIGDFLTHVRGEPASEVEAKLLGSALHHLQSEEDQL